MALLLGGTVGELQQRMGAGEFVEWAAYLSTEPAGDIRGDIQSASIAAMLANINRDRKKHPDAFSLSVFMPDYWHDNTQKSESLLEKFRQFTNPK